MSYARYMTIMQVELHQTEQIKSVLLTLQRWIGDMLFGVYLHGSAVSGGLRPQSDIDLLAVVQSVLAESQLNGLLLDLMHLSGRHPAVPRGARCLEVMVFCQAELNRSDYPARAEFVYGEWLQEALSRASPSEIISSAQCRPHSVAERRQVAPFADLRLLDGRRIVTVIRQHVGIGELDSRLQIDDRLRIELVFKMKAPDPGKRR